MVNSNIIISNLSFGNQKINLLLFMKKKNKRPVYLNKIYQLIIFLKFVLTKYVRLNYIKFYNTTKVSGNLLVLV